MRRIRMWGLLAVFLLAASAPAAADVAIDAANFPDAAFREYVKTNWGGGDGTLSDAEIEAVDSANVCDKGIQSLKGIEHFTALKKLVCGDNQLTALDVSKNEKLVKLDCYNNQLTSLDVSNNKDLKSLHCQENRLTFLDLGGLDKLVPVYVDVGGQTRDGLKVRKIGSEYVVDLGMFLPADRFGRVKALAGKAGGTDLVARYDFVSGKARFDALPDKVKYKYDTGKAAHPMWVRLTTEPVSPDVPPTPPSGPGVPPVTSPVSPEPSSGGGGCDAGLSGLALALVGAFLLRKKV